jgi:hypothetical protein
MSLLDPFSKPRWQHHKAEVRMAAIDQVDDPQVLMEVLKTDEDPAVRARALSRIEDGMTLDRLIDEQQGMLSAELHRQARDQRLAQMLPTAGVLPEAATDATLLRITHLADDPDLIEAAISRISGPEVRADIAASHPVARARLLAAQSLEDIEQLQALMHQARHKDKAVFRHCRERVDEHLATQRAAEEPCRCSTAGAKSANMPPARSGNASRATSTPARGASSSGRRSRLPKSRQRPLPTKPPAASASC